MPPGRLLPCKWSEEKSMKQIIDGKTYNTETAALLAEAESACNPSDFHYWREELYRTRRGAYFLAGEGGPMSSWSISIDQNSWSGGSGIRLLDEDAAREWTEHYSNEDYEDIFGLAEEG
jgi:hypothetical protein